MVPLRQSASGGDVSLQTCMSGKATLKISMGSLQTASQEMGFARFSLAETYIVGVLVGQDGCAKTRDNKTSSCPREWNLFSDLTRSVCILLFAGYCLSLSSELISTFSVKRDLSLIAWCHRLGL